MFSRMEEHSKPGDYVADTPSGYSAVQYPDWMDKHMEDITESLTEHTDEEDYKADGPGQAYTAVPYDVSNLQWEVRSTYGAREYEDTFDAMKDIIHEHSDETEYIEDGPGRAYTAVPYDVNNLQWEVRSTMGVIDPTETPDGIAKTMHSNSHPPGYVSDSPKGYEAVEVQLKKSTLGEADEEDDVDNMKARHMAHSDSDQYVADAPKSVHMEYSD